MNPGTVVGFPPRSADNGHRLATLPGNKPRRTRDLPWPAKLAEYPNRILARWVRKHGPIIWEERAAGEDEQQFGTEIHEAIERYHKGDNERHEYEPSQFYTDQEKQTDTIPCSICGNSRSNTIHPG